MRSLSTLLLGSLFAAEEAGAARQAVRRARRQDRQGRQARQDQLSGGARSVVRDRVAASAVFLGLVACGRVGFEPGLDGSDPAWLDGYGYRKQISIAPLAAADLTDIPLHIALADDIDLARHALVDGADLAVTADDGVSLLAREVVAYDGVSGALDMWVRIAALPAATSTTAYLYYGGAVATAGTTWPPTMVGVWHMNEVAGEFPDGAVGHTARPAGPSAAPGAMDGVAGVAALFDGVDDTLAVSDPPSGSLDFGTRSFSYAVWVRVAQNVGQWDRPLSKGGSSPGVVGYDLELGTGDWEALLSDGTTNPFGAFGPASQFVDRWVQLVAVVDRATGRLRLYADGAEVDAIDISTLGSLDNNQRLDLGHDADWFRGGLDEPRIYALALSSERIAADHANLTRPELITIGQEETR